MIGGDFEALTAPGFGFRGLSGEFCAACGVSRGMWATRTGSDRRIAASRLLTVPNPWRSSPMRVTSVFSRLSARPTRSPRCTPPAARSPAPGR
jgi:hypothetical protein